MKTKIFYLCILLFFACKESKSNKQEKNASSIEEKNNITALCHLQKSYLHRMHDRDQENRQGNFKLEIDLANQDTLIKIIEHCGWPDTAKVGRLGVVAAFLVIQHSNEELMKKYFPFVEKSGDKGEISLGAVATMEDRILVISGKNQKYGTQIVDDKINGGLKLDKYDDICKVIERRKEKGMQPIEDYLAMWDIFLDIDCPID